VEKYRFLRPVKFNEAGTRIMSRLYIVAMSLLTVVGVMSVMAAADTTGRIIGAMMAVAGFAGVVAGIMSRRKKE
jgi:hypothetical protein